MSTGAQPPSLSQDLASPPLGSKANHNPDKDLLEVLELLLKSGKVKSTQDLIRYAEQSHAPDAAERLRRMDAEGIPMDLAFDALSVHLRILAHKRNSALIRSCNGCTVGLICPLPPHLIGLFVPVAKVEFLLPTEAHNLPGYLQPYHDKIVHGSRACRETARQMDILVFEATRENGELFVDPGVSDVVDPRNAGPTTRFVIHIRPHRNPDDVAFVPSTNKVEIL